MSRFVNTLPDGSGTQKIPGRSEFRTLPLRVSRHLDEALAGGFTRRPSRLRSSESEALAPLCGREYGADTFAAPLERSPPVIEDLPSLFLLSRDLEESRRFYTDTLGFKEESAGIGRACYKVGDLQLIVHAPFRRKRCARGDSSRSGIRVGRESSSPCGRPHGCRFHGNFRKGGGHPLPPPRRALGRLDVHGARSVRLPDRDRQASLKNTSPVA